MLRAQYASPELSGKAASGVTRVQTEFSRGFGDWLIANRVGLVCSTYQTGHLIFVGVGANGVPVPSAASFSRAMGISASSQRIYVGTKTEVWRLENILSANEIVNGTFDRFYAPRTADLTGDIDIHELAVEADGRVVFVSARYSCLASISSTRAFKPLWKPKFVSKLAPEDRCHLNGLAIENGRVRYVTACSTGDVIEHWRARRRDGGVVIDVETNATIAEGLSMPHSPRLAGGALYVLESGRGYLVRIDRDTGQREDIAFCPGFARGLAFISHYAVVTVSLPRPGRFEDLPVGETMVVKGVASRCGLLVIDLRTGDIVERFWIDGIAEIFDVGIISDVRCPRAIDPYSPGLETTMLREELA